MLVVGDKVKYRREWLRSAGFFTGPIPFLRGEIIDIVPLSTETMLAVVKWNDGTEGKVNIKNLTKKSDPERV